MAMVDEPLLSCPLEAQPTVLADIGGVVAMVDEPLLSCPLEAQPTVLADGVTAPFVLVVGRDVLK
ncbi:MAG: hypothetical protein ACYCTL_06575, partial [Acidimicrobiales bacterium]